MNGKKVVIPEALVLNLLDWAFDRTMREPEIMDYTKLYGHLIEGVQAALLEVAANPDEVEEIIKAERIW